MSLQIKTTDVIRLILQFLKQNNLEKSFSVLQQESQICINTTNKKNLREYIIQSKWDLVLKQLKNFLLPQQKLFNLMELMVEDMIDNSEIEAAQYIIKNYIKKRIDVKSYQQKILRLEYFCQKNDKSLLWKQMSKQKKKQNVADSISTQIIEPPSQRLLKLLGQSIKYQIAQGIINPNIKLDFFTDHKFQFKQEHQIIAKSVQKIIKYPQQSKILSLKFSNRGQYMAIGCSDGLIQIYDPNNYQVNLNLQYQNQGSFLFHSNPVLSLAFNQTDQMIASGDNIGQVKIWNLKNGKCLRKIQNTSNPVSALTFGIDPSHILSAYEIIYLYGLKSSKVLKQYKGHTAQINSIVLIQNQNQMITGSKDGSIKFWNYFSQEQIKSYSPSSSLIDIDIKMIKLFGESKQRLMVCMKSNSLMLAQADLKTFQNLSLQNKSDLFNSWCVSGLKGLYIYSCIQTYDHRWKLMVHNTKTKRIQYFTNLEHQIYYLEHHPSRNLIVSINVNGDLSFWRP